MSSNHSMEASTVVVGGHKNVIGAFGPVPKRVLRRDELNSRGYERASVPNGREPINGAKVAWHINRNEEEVGFIRVKGPYVAV